MPTLVLRNVPEDLYQRLKETAAQHHRSMTQEAIVSLQAALEGEMARRPKPAVDETLDWLRREVWSLPVLDHRDALAAADVYRRFGKGRYPAGLNCGDCFAYRPGGARAGAAAVQRPMQAKPLISKVAEREGFEPSMGF
jgi:antitoxin VapB